MAANLNWKSVIMEAIIVLKVDYLFVPPVWQLYTRSMFSKSKVWESCMHLMLHNIEIKFEICVIVDW